MGKSGEKWRKVGKSGFFFAKWPPAAILDVQKSLSIAFLAISDQYATFFFFFFFKAGEKWRKVAKSGEKWRKVGKSGKSGNKVGISGKSG